MRQEKIQEVVRTVAASQLKNIINTFEFDELVNEALVAVLEARKKMTLTEGLVATIARRRLIKWKIKNTDCRSIPLGSTDRLYKNHSIAIAESISPINSVVVENEDVYLMKVHEKLIVKDWREQERQRDFSIAVRKAHQKMTVLEKRLLRTILEGGSGRSLVRELSKVKFPAVRQRTAEAFTLLRARLTELGYHE
jgi:hypothetical protein